MKNYQLILSETELVLLQKETKALVERAKRNPASFAEVGAALSVLSEKLDQAQAIKENRSKTKKPAAAAFNLCPEHPNYSAQRAPSIDCPGHWEAYKLMNPTEYDRAKRKYDRMKSTRSNTKRNRDQ